MQEQERIKLKVLGLSYNQIQNGAYALILSQVDGPYSIPVIIGASEAQSIALKMEGIKPPRPLTHDLFVGMGKMFGIRIQEVLIYKFEDGIFYSHLLCSDGDRSVTIDSRTSDAIAIAMRTNSPIFTTKSILDETGFIADTENRGFDTDRGEKEPKLENYTIEELQRTLDKLIEQEKYEEAAKVSAILKQKQESKS